MIFIIGKHLYDISSRESKHLVKFRFDRDVPSYIETAGYIIKRNRTNTHHKDAFEVALEFLEDITVESIGMGDGMIYLLTMLIEHHIGKVIIFIYYQIKRKSLLRSLIMNKSQLIHGILSLAHLLSRLLGISLTIAAHETIQFNGTIEVEIALQ